MGSNPTPSANNSFIAIRHSVTWAVRQASEFTYELTIFVKDWATDWAPSPAEIVEAAKRGELVEAFRRELVEVVLAHTLDDKTEEAYRRTDMIEKRRRLMTAWAEFCGKAPVKGNVIELPTAQRAMA